MVLPIMMEHRTFWSSANQSSERQAPQANSENRAMEKVVKLLFSGWLHSHICDRSFSPRGALGLGIVVCHCFSRIVTLFTEGDDSKGMQRVNDKAKNWIFPNLMFTDWKTILLRCSYYSK